MFYYYFDKCFELDRIFIQNVKVIEIELVNYQSRFERSKA